MVKAADKEIKNEHKICLSLPFSDDHIMPSLRQWIKGSLQLNLSF